MIMESRVYHGKVILFGEYSMIFGSPALLMPYYPSSARWQYAENSNDEFAMSSSRSLYDFLSYLIENEDVNSVLDLMAFKKDLDEGLYFASDIPYGYGVGSSGALTAAVYERYCIDKAVDNVLLRSLLASMENCFHSTSSGLDPMQCYYGRPFVINEDKSLTMLEKDFMPDDVHVFLLDSKVKSNTGQLVSYFRERYADKGFYVDFQRLYYPNVKKCITSLVNGDSKDFYENLSELSYYQTVMMRPMIPDSMMPYFSSRIETEHFQVKICGSGGGGFLLGFADDKNKVNCLMNKNKEKIIWLM